MNATNDDQSTVAVLIPVKAFHLAKRRLANALLPADRAALARRMATHVVSCASPLPVAVVCDDDAVAEWARELGLKVLHEPGVGLNEAVASGVSQLLDQGFGRVIIAHSDLPLATNLRWLADDVDININIDSRHAYDVTIVSDRHGRGTNVLVIPTNVGFEFHYGSDSFRMHLDESERLNLRVRVVSDEALAADVDTPEDFASVFGTIS